MSRLYRPSIPIEVRCRVALRQLGEFWPDQVLKENRRKLGAFLARKLVLLAEVFGCDRSDLRLDHDPALGARLRHGTGKNTRYRPAANDPFYLRYRPHGPQFAGSHLIKTNVRGDRGQFPDRVLIKRERRRKAKRKAKAKTGLRPVRSGKLKKGMLVTWPDGRVGKIVHVMVGRDRPWPKGRKLRSKSSWR